MRARFVLTPGFSLAYQLRISFTRVPIWDVLSCLGLPAVELLGHRHVVGAADEDRRSLVILGGPDLHHAPRAGARTTARLLADHGHRGDLVEQPELRLGLDGI